MSRQCLLTAKIDASRTSVFHGLVVTTQHRIRQERTGIVSSIGSVSGNDEDVSDKKMRLGPNPASLSKDPSVSQGAVKVTA